MPKITRVGGPLGGSPHIFIATPCYGNFYPNYTVALAKSMMALPTWGVRVDLCLLTGNCHVDDSRDTLVNEFIKSDAEQMIFIDSDVGWEPETLMRLVKHERDMVAGVYPLKQALENYPVLTEPGTALWTDRDGLIEVRGVPTGFLKLSRRMVETMLEKHGSRKYRGAHQAPDEPPISILFERTYEDKSRYSGDLAFCRKWKATGGKIYVDPEMLLSHYGESDWAGTLGDYWKRTHGVKAVEDERTLSEAIESLRGGDFTPILLDSMNKAWGNRAAAPVELLATCWHLAREADGPIIECGSGLSTIVMAAANPKVPIHSLECEPAWATKLNAVIAGHGLDNIKLSCKPIETYPEGRWYARDGLPSQPAMTFIDGPWRVHGDRGLAYKFIDLSRSTVLVDDIDDQREGMAAREWSEATGRAMHTMGSGRFAVFARP